jgi:exopolysaccharide biosynthesis polyprenyl glycosylphosphotransferase
MIPAASSTVRRLAVVLDIVAVAGSALAAFGLHSFLKTRLPMLHEMPTPKSYAAIAILVLPVWIGLARVLRLHDIYGERWPLRRVVFRLLVLHVLGFFALAAIVFVTQSIINRTVVFLFHLSSFVSMLSVRVLLVRAAKSRHASGESQTRILLIGNASDEMRRWADELARSPQPGRIVGRLGDADDDVTLPHKGAPDDLGRVLEQEALDHVVFFPPHHRPEDVSALLGACEDRGIPASFLLVLPRPTSAAPRVFEYHSRPFVTFELAPRSPERLAIKHGFDFLAALVAVVVLAPVMAACGLAILVSMGRPLMFVQSRAGRNGRSFRMLKFRTMVPDADAQQKSLHHAGRNGPVFKLARDPRVTRLGGFLRRFSLDELPQLFNVLGGTMSIVGPRPLPLEEQRGITGWHRRRLAMKPGITGLWQVSGRSDVPYSEWMQLDVRYVDTWSLRADAAILWKTIPAVLARRGAY